MTGPTIDDPATPTRRWSAARVVTTVLVVSMVTMWGYVLYLAVVPGRQAPPDRLDNPAFARAAEVRCSAALDEVAALPRAAETRSTAERADAIGKANIYLAEMLDDLYLRAPEGEDGVLVHEWLDDWHAYLEDREAYAIAVRNDPDAQLLVTAKDHAQVTEYLDAFAGDNNMPACATPLDV